MAVLTEGVSLCIYIDKFPFYMENTAQSTRETASYTTSLVSHSVDTEY